METNEKTKKNGILKAIIILVILVVTALGFRFAYARYITKLNGQVTAKVANWTLKVNEATENEQFAINLAQTKDTQKSKSRNSNFIEPGDQGAFNLVIDAGGTKVSLVYNMEIDISGMPKNLILFADEQMLHKIPVVDNSTNNVTDRKIKLEDYIGIDDNSQTQTKRVYWQWPYESGTSDVEIEENDVDDSRYMGSTMEMSVNITAKQIDVEPVYLAKKVSVGDLVNYNANVADANGNTFTTPYTYTTDSATTGSSTQSSFSSADSMDWKVLYKNEDFGIVELISANGTPNSLYLNGRTGFTNSIGVLNEISSLYGYGYGANSGRSITMDDIEQYSSYDKTNYTSNQAGSYGDRKTYTVGDYFFKEVGKVVKDDGTVCTGYKTTCSIANEDNPIEMTMTYTVWSTSSISSNYRDMLLKDSNGNTKPKFFIATRLVGTYQTFCTYELSYYNYNSSESYFGGHTLCRSNGTEVSWGEKVIPVVLLDTTLKTNSNKNNNQEWDLIL